MTVLAIHEHDGKSDDSISREEFRVRRRPSTRGGDRGRKGWQTAGLLISHAPPDFGTILRLLSIRKLKENLLPKGGVLAGGDPKRAIFGIVWLGTLKK